MNNRSGELKGTHFSVKDYFLAEILLFWGFPTVDEPGRAMFTLLFRDPHLSWVSPSLVEVGGPCLALSLTSHGWVVAWSMGALARAWGLELLGGGILLVSWGCFPGVGSRAGPPGGA